MPTLTVARTLARTSLTGNTPIREHVSDTHMKQVPMPRQARWNGRSKPCRKSGPFDIASVDGKVQPKALDIKTYVGIYIDLN